MLKIVKFTDVCMTGVIKHTPSQTNVNIHETGFDDKLVSKGIQQSAIVRKMLYKIWTWSKGPITWRISARAEISARLLKQFFNFQHTFPQLMLHLKCWNLAGLLKLRCSFWCWYSFLSLAYCNVFEFSAVILEKGLLSITRRRTQPGVHFSPSWKNLM